MIRRRNPWLTHLSSWGIVLVLVLLCSLPRAALAADATRGSMLYENHCMGCHESMVHMRAQREVRSLNDLRRQMRRWVTELQLDWTREELEDVEAYLDGRFYGFLPAPNRH